MLRPDAFWHDFLATVRGWAIGLTIATVLAVPIGIALGLSDFAAQRLPGADRVPAPDPVRRRSSRCSS